MWSRSTLPAKMGISVVEKQHWHFVKINFITNIYLLMAWDIILWFRIVVWLWKWSANVLCINWKFPLVKEKMFTNNFGMLNCMPVVDWIQIFFSSWKSFKCFQLCTHKCIGFTIHLGDGTIPYILLFCYVSLLLVQKGKQKMVPDVLYKTGKFSILSPVVCL